MKGDFTRFTHDPAKHYTRVLKQQGRVDLDADWNEQADLATHLERVEAIDVIGRCGVPEDGGGFGLAIDGGALTVSPGRLYVDGLLCRLDADAPVPLDAQPDLPGYAPPTDDGTYVAYADVWERHVTYVEDPDLREVALGGPDTTTRVRTLAQVRLAPHPDTPDPDAPLTGVPCAAPGLPPHTGRLAARTTASADPDNPCVVPTSGGYRGLENRLYRVEIHDDGRNADGTQVRTPTFKWSRDNGAVVLPVSGIAADVVTVETLGWDDVLTVDTGDWVEVLGDETELNGRPGTLAQVDGPPDRADRQIDLSADVSAHAAEGHVKLRRWDHQATPDVALQDGALPIQDGWFELEDGVEVRFDAAARYDVGDYWLIPARTRTASIEWPEDPAAPGTPAERPPRGIQHHRCTLAVVRRAGGAWVEVRDCRRRFPPLTEVGDGGCCATVEPGSDIQAAIDAVAAAGGGCVSLCAGVHEVTGPLRLVGVRDVRVVGEGLATVVRFRQAEGSDAGGFLVERSDRVGVERLLAVTDDVRALVTVRPDVDFAPSRGVTLAHLTLANAHGLAQDDFLAATVRLAQAEGVAVRDCRLLAQAGLVALWGAALPDLDPQEPPPDDAGPVLNATFDDRAADERFEVGDTFQSNDLTFTVEAFATASGVPIDGGDVRIDDQDIVGNGGLEANTRSARLRAELPTPYRFGQCVYAHFGGSVNLRINGDLRTVGRFSDLDGATVGGVRLTVQATDLDNAQVGQITLEESTQPISGLALGGAEVWLDRFVFRAPVGAPTPDLDLRFGDGVTDAQIRDTVVRFGEVGVLAAHAERWTLAGCDVQPYPRRTQAMGTLRAQLAEAATPEAYAGVLATLEALFAADALGAEPPMGTALLAYGWHASAVRASRLVGDRGVLAWWWRHGPLADSTVRARRLAASAFWLYRADWSGNRLAAPDGAGGVVFGSYGASLAYNRIDAADGLVNASVAQGGQGLGLLGQMLARAYGESDNAFDRFTVAWMMTEEAVDLLGLRALVDALQDSLGEALGGYPVTLLLATALPQAFDGDGGGVALPQVNLELAHNEVRSSGRCVALTGLPPLGALSVVHNLLHSPTGQALRLDAVPYFGNGHLLALGLRLVLRALLRQVDEALEEDEEGDTAVLEALRDLLAAWQAGAEALFDLDLRVESNTLRSLRTAIASNLAGLAVLDNHVTLQERPLREVGVGSPFAPATALTYAVNTLPEIAAIIEAVEGSGSAAIAPLATALRDGSPLPAQLYAQSLTGSGGAFAGDTDAAQAERAAAAATVATVGGLTADPALRQTAASLSAALRANDDAQLGGLLRRFFDGLNGYIDSQGLRLAGLGGRIVGNQIHVPADARAETQSLGGLQVSVSALEVQIAAVAIAILLQLLGEDADLEPDALLGITQTLVDANEIVGGMGHGISVQGLAGVPDFVQDLCIRDNEVRGLAGAGIYLNEHALALGVEIAGNEVADCGRAAGFAQAKGGILVQTAALCTVRGNRVARCGQTGSTPLGIDLDSVFGLQCTGNHLTANGPAEAATDGGGLRLQEVYGRTLVHDNVLDQNRGLALAWTNSARADEEALLPEFLLDAVNRYQGNVPRKVGDLKAGEMASIQGNALAGAVDLVLVRLLNLNGVAFSGNACRKEQGATPLGEIQEAARAVVANNLLDTTGEVTLSLKKMDAGVVHGNVGNQPIRVQSSPDVVRATNVPPAIT